MSGFAALFDREGSGVERDHLNAMIRRINHRGPDGSGTWYDDHIALGHQQLQSTPESQFDNQPLRGDDGLVLVADARIDNRKKLIDVVSPERNPNQLPDSQLILGAYRRWGTECANHLVGAFSFTIWDPNEERLFCARDHLGVKPFYYHEDDEVFVAGSEVKVALSNPSVSREINETKIGDYLINLREDKENTYYKSIHRLPPAHVMVVTTDKMEQWRYWTLDSDRTIKLNSDRAYERRFRELFEQSVKCRLRTNKKLGVSFSGGLDSSSITTMTRHLIDDTSDLHTFSAVFDDAPESDEREFIEAIACRDGINQHNINLDGLGYFDSADEFMPHLDIIPPAGAFVIMWELAKNIDSEGIDVCLTGNLGDSVVGYGLELLPHLLLTLRWKSLYEELRSMSSFMSRPTTQLFIRYVVKPLIPEEFRSYYHKVLQTRYEPNKEISILNDTFVNDTNLKTRLEELGGDRRWQGPNDRYRWSVLLGSNTAALEITDLMYAGFAIEPRHPFSDKRLLEFLSAIPASQRLRHGQTRSILRRSLEDILPKRIRNRPGKTMMNHAIVKSLLREDERLDDLISNNNQILTYFDQSQLRNVLRQFRRGNKFHYQDAKAIYRALWVQMWIKKNE